MPGFEDLEVWKRSARLSADIYKTLANLKDFGFKDQIYPVEWKRLTLRNSKMYYVYVLLSGKDGNFYVGYTSDLRKRVIEHDKGQVASTKKRRPLQLVYYEASRNQQDATTREKYLKSTYGRRYLRNRMKYDFGYSSE